MIIGHIWQAIYNKSFIKTNQLCEKEKIIPSLRKKELGLLFSNF